MSLILSSISGIKINNITLTSSCINEDVKVIGFYGKFAYIIKNKEIGWIESGYLEKI